MVRHRLRRILQRDSEVVFGRLKVMLCRHGPRIADPITDHMQGEAFL
jgi:hypothetical protein